MRRGNVRRFPGPNRGRAQENLTDDQPQPRAGQFRQRMTPAEPAIGQPRSARHQQQDGQRHDPMRHLQNNLKRGDGIDRIDLDTVLVVAGDGFGIQRRPEAAISRRKVRNGQARVLMPHGRAQNQLRENQKRRKQEQRAQTTVVRPGGLQ